MEKYETILKVLAEKIESLELENRVKQYRIEQLEKELKEAKEKEHE